MLVQMMGEMECIGLKAAAMITQASGKLMASPHAPQDRQRPLAALQRPLGHRLQTAVKQPLWTLWDPFRYHII